jgi:spore maturation protein CgeB
MAHYALLDSNNIVTWVITGNDEDFVHEGISDWEEYYGAFHGQKCLRTSYNTHEGAHSQGSSPFRGNFAGIGYTYDEELDAFIPAKPEGGEWVLDEDTYSWVEVAE